MDTEAPVEDGEAPRVVNAEDLFEPDVRLLHGSGGGRGVFLAFTRAELDKIAAQSREGNFCGLAEVKVRAKPGATDAELRLKIMACVFADDAERVAFMDRLSTKEEDSEDGT